MRVDFGLDRSALRSEHLLCLAFSVVLLLVSIIYSPVLMYRLASNLNSADAVRLIGAVVALVVALAFVKAANAVQLTASAIEKSGDQIKFTCFSGRVIDTISSDVLTAPVSVAFSSKRGGPANTFYRYLNMTTGRVCVRSDWLSEIYKLASTDK